MNITLFSNLYSKEAQGVIDAAEWRDAIRDGKYRTIVEKIRHFIEKGMKDEAREWKMKLPAVVFAGDCRMGRFFAKTTARTGWLMFDFDNLTPQQVKAARDLLIVFEWVVMVHVTSSGRGLRILEAGWQVTEFTCQDEDFDSAMAIVQYCMKHSTNITTMLMEKTSRNKISGFYKVMPVLKSMDEKFRFTDFKSEALKRGICDSTMKRALKRYLESGLLSKRCNIYKKSELLLKGFI